MHIMGSQDAEDCYDVIEAIAELPWCNGNIGMAGNSALAIIQWLVASLQPPHLAAIAPWEGSGDIYREQFCRGGWFQMSNFDLITREILKGKNGVEDFAEMYKRYPLSNEYWADKRADMTKIQCPVYISGSDFSSIHTMGAVRGWMELPHDNKWIRWSSYQEWYELYCVKSADEELHKYFDRYLKGIENGWEKDTPKVRWRVSPASLRSCPVTDLSLRRSALQFGDREAIDDIVYPDFPIPGTEYKEFFLQNGTLTKEAPTEAIISTYDSESTTDVVDFKYTFQEKTRLIGLPKAVIYVSCDDKDDMIVFVNLRKRDKDGNLLMHLTFPFDATPYKSIADIPKKEQASLNLHLGSNGILRASHRAYDPERSIHPNFPFHPHDKEEKITPGEVVRLEIGIWAMGNDYDAGESISVQVGGHLPSIAEFAAWSVPRPEEERNKGIHKIHSSPEHPSSIILPFVPN
jgi:predicted acyl esterase